MAPAGPALLVVVVGLSLMIFVCSVPGHRARYLVDPTTARWAAPVARREVPIGMRLQSQRPRTSQRGGLLARRGRTCHRGRRSPKGRSFRPSVSPLAASRLQRKGYCHTSPRLGAGSVIVVMGRRRRSDTETGHHSSPWKGAQFPRQWAYSIFIEAAGYRNHASQSGPAGTAWEWHGCYYLCPDTETSA